MKDTTGTIGGEKTNMGRIAILLLLMMVSIGFILFYNYYMSTHPVDSVLTVDMFTYQKDLEDGYRLYLRENDVYTPYLVLYEDYDKEGNVLLLREKIIGGLEGSTMQYNGLAVEQEVFDGQMPMSSYEEYKDTEVDTFLNEDFEMRFDKKVCALFQDAKLNLSRYVDGTDINYTIFRKTFLLSNIELGFGDTYDNNTKNRNVIEYFNQVGRIAENEAGAVIPWWTRSYCWGSYGAVGYDGSLLSESGTEAKFGVRPALLLAPDTPVISYHDETLGDIYILQADQRQTVE